MPFAAKLFLCALLVSLLPAQATPLVVMVDTGTEMPMAGFEGLRLVDGVHKDVGVELARHLGREAVFQALPRKRIGRPLEEGQGDVLCAYVPPWLDGHFGWSVPFLPVTEVVATVLDAPRPHALADLAGQKIGTVLGYRYPEMEAALGARFVREDASNAQTNLRKLSAGRIRHAIIVKSALDYSLKIGEPPLHLHPPFVIKTTMTQCAVSLKGQVKLEDVNRALAQMVRDGTVAAILGRYQ